MKRKRGTALILVLTIIPLVGLALLGVSRALASDQNRTFNDLANAQARQLLIAADDVIRSRLSEIPLGKSQIVLDLPDELEGCSMAIEVERFSDHSVAEVNLDLGVTKVDQVVRYKLRGGVWEIEAVDSIERRRAR